MSIEKVLYRATGGAVGGRDGRAATTDGQVDLGLTTPRELGGMGGAGTNPEKLFACGYSACFLGAMKFVEARDKLAMPADAGVRGVVRGAIPTGFGIEVDLGISLPGMDCPPPKRWSSARTSCARTRTRLATTSTCA